MVSAAAAWTVAATDLTCGSESHRTSWLPTSATPRWSNSSSSTGISTPSPWRTGARRSTRWVRWGPYETGHALPVRTSAAREGEEQRGRRAGGLRHPRRGGPPCGTRRPPGQGHGTTPTSSSWQEPGSRVLRPKPHSREDSPTRCCWWEGATASCLNARMDGAWVLHRAAHAHVRSDNPLFSSLKVADGPLTVYEIDRLARATHHVVLSACDTGQSHSVPGREILGFGATMLGGGNRNPGCAGGGRARPRENAADGLPTTRVFWQAGRWPKPCPLPRPKSIQRSCREGSRSRVGVPRCWLTRWSGGRPAGGVTSLACQPAGVESGSVSWISEVLQCSRYQSAACEVCSEQEQPTCRLIRQGTQTWRSGCVRDD